MIIGENYSEFKKLYLACFLEDTEEDADFLFNTVFKNTQCICRLEKGSPIAMLFLMDCTLKTPKGDLPFYYLYAAATHPDYRGKGLMGKLLCEAKEFAVKTGRKGIFLKPATASLFGFYAKSDFRPFFKINKLILSPEELAEIKIADNVETISTFNWREERQNLLKNISDCYAHFSPDLYTAATEGCKILKYGKVYAVYEVRGETLLIKECLFKENDGEKLLPLVKYILEKTGAKNVEVRMPINLNLPKSISSKKTETHFSVIWDTGEVDFTEFSNPYHGFAFD